MKINYRFIKLSIMFLLLGLLACNKREERENHEPPQMKSSKILYTCPMPEDSVFSNKPGNCPKCGMELIKVEQADNKTDTLASLIQPTNHFVISQLKAIAPSFDKGVNRISVDGYLTYDPDKANSISARVSGRIEKLYVRYNFQKVNKGEKLLEISSPELVTAQNEFLYLNKSKVASDQNAIDGLRYRLFNLGMTKNDIVSIRNTGKANSSIPVYANASGHIHFLNGNADISLHAFGITSSAMGKSNLEGDDLQVLREGDYVKTGDVLFTIANQSAIWALFKVKPSDISAIKKGEAVEVSVNDEVHKGKVDFIEKSFEDFYTVRVYLQCNDHSKLKIGTLLKGYISARKANQNSIWVPALSVLSLGKLKSAVFVKKPLGYEAKTIQTGTQAGDWLEVTKGLLPGDSIAPVAAYLVDSEAFIVTE